MRHIAATSLLIALGAVTTAAQTAPTINSFTIDNGAAETTSDAVTLRFTYTNPSGIGMPIAHYRIRYKSPTQADFFAFGQWLTGPQGMPTLSMTLARNGSAPIPGEHRYQLQLRDASGTVSSTAAASIRRVVAASAPPPVLFDTYRVSGSQVAELVRLARQKGFQFAALPANGNTTCKIEDQANKVTLVIHERTYGIELPKPVCRFRAFEGRSLQPNWHQQTVTVAPAFPNFAARSSWVFEQPVKPAGRDPSFVLHATITQVRGPALPLWLSWMVVASHELKEIVLTGPSGKTWRQAFEP